ncbi:Uncharacterised protein [Mycobacteroides abscessus subsp. abscessus]|nr:Uncharacterised protein [Mycobacteroides abscessus subsp. abscessus]
MDLAAGDAMHGLDGVTDGDDVIGQCAFHAPRHPVGAAEVDDPRVDAGPVQDAHRTAVLGDIPHVGGHHHRMHHEHDGPGILRPRTRREVAAQPVHGHALDNLVRRGSAPGFQSPQP